MRNINGAMLLRFHKFSPRLSPIGAVLGCAALAQNAFAQSSGTDAVEEDMSEVVVSATRVRQIGLVGDQTAPKSRVSLSGDYLDKQTAGNTLFQAINQVPGVNFTSNDGYGTSGGNLRIRGFDGSRVSVTFDGIPLNDSGNYALFTNQMLDPELVDRVDVNLGTADVDSPTASATGGTVAFRTRRPSDEFGGQAIMSGGTDNYMRGLLRVDTGEMGPWGTKAFVALSHQEYDKFKGPGELKKDQFNAMIRQDFENENFISLAFHYNRNRNAFFRTTSNANYLAFGRDYDNLDTCTRDAPTFNVVDNDNGSPVASTPTLAQHRQSCESLELRQLLRRAHQSLGYGQRPHAVAVAPRREPAPDLRPVLAVHAGQRRRQPGPHRVFRQHRGRASGGRHQPAGLRPERRQRHPRHRALLCAQHHQHQALGNQYVADLGPQRVQSPALGLHLGSRPSSPDRHVRPDGSER